MVFIEIGSNGMVFAHVILLKSLTYDCVGWNSVGDVGRQLAYGTLEDLNFNE